MQPLDWAVFARHVKADYLPHAAIIDCSASQDVANRYVDWVRAGIHVVTPNKKAHSGSLAAYDSLLAECRRHHTHFLYETTVGAALPVIGTLRDLIQTGDEIVSIEGILSGTLAYLFNVFDGKRPFSAIVREARDKGYTEPDPRDDLSGMDFARKLIILGREMGMRLEMKDVQRREPRAGGPRQALGVDAVPGQAGAASTRAMLAALAGGARTGQGAALRGPPEPRIRRDGTAGGAAGGSSVRSHEPHRQHRALRVASLQHQPAGGAGPRRGTRP